LASRVVGGFGWTEGKMERRFGAGGGGAVGLGGVGVLVGIVVVVGFSSVGLRGMLSAGGVVAGVVGDLLSVATWAVRVEILGKGVSGSEESGLGWLCLLDCICLVVCQEAELGEPEGLIFRGRVKGVEVLRLAVLGAELSADVRRDGAELMRCICLSVGGDCILELRFPVESLVLQYVEDGKSPTKDCGLSPFSEIEGGGTILDSCFEAPSVSKGMLCRELRTLPRGAIGGSAVIDVEGFQPMTGESSPRSVSTGDDILVLIVRSMGGPDGIGGGGPVGIADLRLAELLP
jgi:hypothetical protein